MLPDRDIKVQCVCFNVLLFPSIYYSQNLAHPFNESANRFTPSQSASIWEALPTASEPVHMLLEIGVNNAKTY